MSNSSGFQVQDSGSWGIYILIMKTGQLKKLHPDVENTTFFTFHYTKFVTVLVVFIKTSPIALWHHVIDTGIVLKTGLRRLVKMIRNCCKKCMTSTQAMENQRLLKFGLCLILKKQKLCVEKFSKALSLKKSKLFSHWNGDILMETARTPQTPLRHLRVLGAQGTQEMRIILKSNLKINFRSRWNVCLVWIWANKSKSCVAVKMKHSRCKWNVNRIEYGSIKYVVYCSR